MSAILEARGVGKTFGGGLFDKVKTVALRDFSLGIENDHFKLCSILKLQKLVINVYSLSSYLSFKNIQNRNSN